MLFRGGINMKNKTCCFTGHREISEKELVEVRAKTKEEITALIESGVICFVAGGATGFDTLAAEIVLEVKKLYPHVKLILVLPCANQDRGWGEEDRAKYNYIKSKADEVKILSQNYYRGCMHVRNRHMVDNSGYCICYQRKPTGGTAYTVNYAIKNNLHMIYV